jgi:hypothetical protein
MCVRHITFFTRILTIFSGLSIACQITGATGGVNYSTLFRPSRLEINDLAQSGPAWDLYVSCRQQGFDNRKAKLRVSASSYYWLS